MNNTNKSTNKLNLWVFQDQLKGRFFQIPLSWFSQLAILSILVLSVSFLSIAFAIRTYRIAKTANPARLSELEKELQDVRKAYQDLETRTETTSSTLGAPHTATNTPENLPSFSFTAYPNATLSMSIPTPETLPFQVHALKAITTSSQQVRVTGNIQYIRTDGTSQQGRIIILARGPETLVAYPTGVLNSTDKNWLIEPSNGEYFSVSRFREIRADLGPFRSRESAKEVELLIFSQEKRLLYRAVLQIEKQLTQPIKKSPTPLTTPLAPPATPSATPPAALPATSPIEVPPPGAPEP